MKLDDAYWTEMFLRFRGSFGNPCIRPQKTMRLLKQIAADARREQAGKDREAVELVPKHERLIIPRPNGGYDCEYYIDRKTALAAIDAVEGE